MLMFRIWGRRFRWILRLTYFFAILIGLTTILSYFIFGKVFLSRWIKGGSFKLAHSTNSERYAYATLLCDDVMTDAIKVLIYSIKRTTNLPFLLLVLPAVKQRSELELLGAEIHEISMLDYPFRVTAEKAAINKMCRYSKLHIWRFTEYKKIIFIDVDCLVMSSLDEAFKFPEFSAVRDAGDTFNTGLFVLEPSLSTWEKMKESYFTAPSYNQGDQGFINWYFRNSPKAALPVCYNTVCKHKGHAVWPLMKRQAKMIHYTSETKPWNFFSSSHKYWRQNFDASMYYLWNKTLRKVLMGLKTDVFDIKSSMWINSKRTMEICERYFPTIENLDLQDERISNKTSILIIKWRNVQTLTNAIQHYRTILEPAVHKIYISWNPSLGTPGIEINRLKFLLNQPKVELVFHRFESVNNIWNPILGLKTKTVFLANDENLPDLEKLEVALETWRNSKNSLVGFFARFHTKQKLTQEADEFEKMNNDTLVPNEAAVPATLKSSSIIDDTWTWVYNLTSTRRPRPYSILSSQLLLIPSDYLFIYTCLLPDRIHKMVEEFPDDNSDLAMNVMVAGMTGARPYVIKSDFHDPEASKTDSIARGNSLKKIIKAFNGGNKDPLTYNTISVAQFNKIPFKKRSIKQWNKVN